MCRPRSAPTRPRVRHGISSSVSTSATGCGVRGGLGGDAAGTCARACHGVVRVLTWSPRVGVGAVRPGAPLARIPRGRGTPGSSRGRDLVWRPPRTHPPGTGCPGVVTGSGLNTHDEAGRRRGVPCARAHRAGGGRAAVGHALRQGGGVDGGACCGARGHCGQRGRHSCGMPLILERRGHPGTFLGVGCPFGTWPQPAGARVLTVQCPRGRPSGRAAQRDNGVRPPRQTVTGELRRLVPPRGAHPGERSSSTTWPRGAEPSRRRRVDDDCDRCSF